MRIFYFRLIHRIAHSHVRPSCRTIMLGEVFFFLEIIFVFDSVFIVFGHIHDNNFGHICLAFSRGKKMLVINTYPIITRPVNVVDIPRGKGRVERREGKISLPELFILILYYLLYEKTPSFIC